MIKRALYIGYYLKQTDWTTLRKFMAYTTRESKILVPGLWVKMVFDALRYNISLLEYFQFRFFEKSPMEKSFWAGTGYMYEYQLIMNPPKNRHLLENKIQFLKYYNQFIKRNFLSFDEIVKEPSKADYLINNATDKIVLKLSTGQVGAEVKVIDCKEINVEGLINLMTKYGFDLVEEFVVQHPELMKLSPSGLNTIRIFTQLNKSQVIFLGARLRISINSTVDNMAAGNIAAPLDQTTGEVTGPGVYSDITKQEESVHPVTGESIIGFKVPHWADTLNMVTKAALMYPQNKSIGWDIAITTEGPELIEGNHNWCKLLWQLPVKKGLKALIHPYLVEARKIQS